MGLFSFINAFLHLLQTVFGAYNLYLASISITNLMKYEETSKKAAKYSGTAEEELWRTRTTQGSLAGAISLTFITSLLLVLFSTSFFTKIIITATNIIVLSLARAHVGEFWDGKVKIPGVGAYNDAISITREVRLNMLYLAASWWVTGVLGLVG